MPPKIPPTKQPLDSEKWTTGLFDCLTDMGSCCTTMCCPCITFGQIANILDQGKTSCFSGGKTYALLTYLSFVGCCFYSCFYRSKLRYMFKLPASPCGCSDCMVHFCCQPCALCQEYRELQNRGFNMSIGWELNMQTNVDVDVNVNVDVGAHYSTTQTNPVPQEQMTQTHDDHYQY